MIVLPKKFESFEKIPILNDKNTPDVVFYMSVFKENIINELIQLLNITMKDSHMFFCSDNPKINYKKLSTNVFPAFLEDIRDSVEKITTFNFNSCLIHKEFALKSNQVNITPSIIIGCDTKVVFKNKLTFIEKKFDIKNGSLLIQRETTPDYWDIEIYKTKVELPFFILSFVDMYIEHNNILKKQLHFEGKLSVSPSKIYLSTKQRILFKQKIYGELHKNNNFRKKYRCILKDSIDKLNE